MAESLAQAVANYEVATEISTQYAYQLNYAVGRLRRFLKREPTVADLTADTVNRWLKHERDAGEIGDRSRANVRRSMLTIWKRFGSGLNRDQVRSVAVTPRNPEAWSYSELERVAEAAKKLPGQMTNGIRRSLYYPAVLWFAYETGLRRRDIWDFDLQLFDSNRLAAFTQHKTRRVHVIQITEETEAEVRKIARELRGNGDAHWRTPLRWPQASTQFYYWMRQARTMAGVDPDVHNRSLQHVRRTGATEVVVEGGQAWRFLGHSREGLDRKSYVDSRMTVAPTTPNRNRSHGRERRA